MKTKTIKIYQFDELSDDAKEKAREWFREGGFDYEWYDSVYEDAKTIGAIMGINIDKIYFSGFWSQGDGACFEGKYSYAKDSVKKLLDYAPQDAELHRIVKALRAVQKPAFYRLSATVKQSGHYSHSRCTDISVFNEYDSATENQENEITELLRDFMDWIYKTLNAEYDYLNSDEQVDETIRINEYTFDKDGRRDVHTS